MQISLQGAVAPRLAFAVPSSFDRYMEFLLIWIGIICKASKYAFFFFFFFQKDFIYFTREKLHKTLFFHGVLDAPCSVQN